MRKARHFLAVTALVIVGTLFLYVLFTGIPPYFQGILALPLAASAEAGSIDFLANAHFWMIAFLFSLIMTIMLYSAYAFRRREDDQDDGPHVHGNTALEIGWTIVPTFIVIGFGIWGAVMLNDLTAPKPDEMTVNVVGRQWSWSFSYPEQDDIPSAALVLPVGRPIVLQMTSEDVLHSFWVPEFRVKQDLVPGRTTTLRITPTVEGEYKVRCAEICGLDHTNMLAPVQVVSQAEFDAWVEDKSNAPVFSELTPAEVGELMYGNEYGYGCVGCHSLDGSAGAGPTWQGIYGREEALDDGTTVVVDDAYIRESIYEPNANIVAGFQPNVMPQTYQEQFAEREAEILADEGVEIDLVDALIAFMQTIE